MTPEPIPDCFYDEGCFSPIDPGESCTQSLDCDDKGNCVEVCVTQVPGFVDHKDSKFDRPEKGKKHQDGRGYDKKRGPHPVGTFEPIEMPSECGGVIISQNYPFEPGKKVEIDAVPAGHVLISVTLMKGKQPVEQGLSEADVRVGEDTAVSVVLKPVDGGLIIDVIRPDEALSSPLPTTVFSPSAEPVSSPAPIAVR